MSPIRQRLPTTDLAPALALVAASSEGRSPLGPLSGAIAPGERVAILGAGGRDLLQWWVRLADPHHGQVLALGQPVQAIDPLTLRQRVALVRGTAPLLALTVAEALAAPLRWAGRSPVAIEAQVLAALDRFGLDRSWLVRRDFQLSPADRLWVALVRASLWEPAVLLLDDVWSRLSEDQGNRLQRILEAGWGAEGAAPTVVLVGPTTESLTRWVTRVWVLDGGQLTRDCSVEDWDWSAWSEPVDPAATPNEGTDPDADWF